MDFFVGKNRVRWPVTGKIALVIFHFISSYSEETFYYSLAQNFDEDIKTSSKSIFRRS